MASSRLQILLLGTLSACTTYTPSDVSVATVIAATADHPGGALSLDQANLLALQRNPEILAALAEQRAAAAVVQPLMLAAEYRSGTEMLALMLDPVALLGSGPRGGAQGVDATKATAALVAVREAVWRVHGELLETFAVDRALAELDVPGCEVDGAAFAVPTQRQVLDAKTTRGPAAGVPQLLADPLQRTERIGGQFGKPEPVAIAHDVEVRRVAEHEVAPARQDLAQSGWIAHIATGQWRRPVEGGVREPAVGLGGIGEEEVQPAIQAHERHRQRPRPAAVGFDDDVEVGSADFALATCCQGVAGERKHGALLERGQGS